MSGSMFGANPEELAALGRTLSSQIDAINSVVSTVSSVLGGTTWVGPAREQFENDWRMSFTSALTRLNEAFDAAGRDCVSRSQELQRVMGVR